MARLATILAAILVIVEFIACDSSEKAPNGSQGPTAAPASAPLRIVGSKRRSVVSYHGYTVSHKVDFWDTDAALCQGLNQIAEGLVNGEQTDVNSLDGHHSLAEGTHVSVIGHKSGYCSGSSVKMDLTEVEVHDGNSDVNGDDGYINEGSLAKV